MRYILVVLSDQFLLRIADDAAKPLVDAEDAAFDVAECDADGRVLERPAEPLFTLPQLLLGLFAVGDILQEPGNARGFPILILDGEGATADPADRAVRPHHPELPVREHTVLLLLHALDRLVPI